MEAMISNNVQTVACTHPQHRPPAAPTFDMSRCFRYGHHLASKMQLSRAQIRQLCAYIQYFLFLYTLISFFGAGTADIIPDFMGEFFCPEWSIAFHKRSCYGTPWQTLWTNSSHAWLIGPRVGETFFTQCLSTVQGSIVIPSALASIDIKTMTDGKIWDLVAKNVEGKISLFAQHRTGTFHSTRHYLCTFNALMGKCLSINTNTFTTCASVNLWQKSNTVIQLTKSTTTPIAINSTNIMLPTLITTCAGITTMVVCFVLACQRIELRKLQKRLLVDRPTQIALLPIADAPPNAPQANPPRYTAAESPPDYSFTSNLS